MARIALLTVLTNSDMLNFRNSEILKMSDTLLVSGRGQITLPAAVRKRLGIRPGGVVIAEERGSELVLRPAAVLALETYTKEQIARWDAEDRLTPAERRKLNKRPGKGRR